MTEEQKIQIANLRKAEFSYKRIAFEMNISENTVKSFCRRNGLNGRAKSKRGIEDSSVCKFCGVKIEQISGRKQKKFCSDSCRMKWWNSHLCQVNRKAVYEYECPYCRKKFSVYGNSKRKYCSHECYIADRFGGVTDDGE